jgi:hypothetical protein
MMMRMMMAVVVVIYSPGGNLLLPLPCARHEASSYADISENWGAILERDDGPPSSPCREGKHLKTMNWSNIDT